MCLPSKVRVRPQLLLQAVPACALPWLTYPYLPPPQLTSPWLPPHSYLLRLNLPRHNLPACVFTHTVILDAATAAGNLRQDTHTYTLKYTDPHTPTNTLFCS